MATDRRVLQTGDAKHAPYTIVFVANPALEAPWRSGQFIADAMPSNKAAFDASVAYALDCILGRLPGQAEVFMGDPAIGPHIRVESIRETGLPATPNNALAGESPLGQLLAPRRDEAVAFVRRHEVEPDVVFVISSSTVYSRASAFGTTDDVTRAGTPFVLDGANNTHWHFAEIPGTAALHHTNRSLTPLHEFGHAASSYQSGFVDDLYVDGVKQLNRRVGRPIPAQFATYAGAAYLSDLGRGGLGYPPSWKSYHCQHMVPALPAAMDDYTAVANPLLCRHDEMTIAYMADRLIAKIGR